jgi:hypothetical protein
MAIYYGGIIMADMVEKQENKQWAVLQSEVAPGAGHASGMWAGVTIFDSLEEAKKFIEYVIRTEWTTTIAMPTDTDPCYEEMLADHKGYQSDPNSIRWSECYYSADGTLAWHEIGDAVKLIEAVELKPNGERASTTC